MELTAADLTEPFIEQILQDARLVYFDGRFTDVAIILAQAARQKQIPVLVECERPRGKLDKLLLEADFVCTSAHFPQAGAITANAKVDSISGCWNVWPSKQHHVLRLPEPH